MKFFLLFLLGILLSGMPAVAKKHILYVGTYTQGMTNGIFVYKFNDQSGKLVDLEIPVVINNPSFLTISPNKKFLYAVGELDNLDSNQSGGLSAFGIEKKGNLTLINHVLTHGANPCHVSLSPDGKKLVASNYTGGNLSLFNILSDGSLSEMVQRIQHTGSGPFPERQTEAHAHSAQFDSSGKLLFAADLGIDELKIYKVGTGEIPLTPNSQPFVRIAPGSGPRHFDFSADGRFIYVINELSSTITVLMKYGDEWKEIQTIKTLPKDFSGESWCADIHLSADGRFVYGSNRGHNSITVFNRNNTNGKLEKIQTVSVEGNWPRNFTIDPSGRYLLVANQKSNDITVFKIDQPSGKLAFTGIKVSNESPVCLQFLE
ncbi:MAG TPA: lactonase family protein [Prolixibacteraceae bacterium]|nr:lactonase family protein [Prolixibacteraceae bacterium]